MLRSKSSLWTTYFFFVQTMHERDREADIEGLVWQMASTQGLEAQITHRKEEGKNNFYPIEMSCRLELGNQVDFWFAPEICLQVTRTRVDSFQLIFSNGKGVPRRIIENAEGFSCGSNSRDNRPVDGVEDLFLYVTGKDHKIHSERISFETEESHKVVPFSRYYSTTES